jgi:hypothetical protein
MKKLLALSLVIFLLISCVYIPKWQRLPEYKEFSLDLSHYESKGFHITTLDFPNNYQTLEYLHIYANPGLYKTSIMDSSYLFPNIGFAKTNFYPQDFLDMVYADAILKGGDAIINFNFYITYDSDNKIYKSGLFDVYTSYLNEPTYHITGVLINRPDIIIEDQEFIDKAQYWIDRFQTIKKENDYEIHHLKK